MTLIVLLLLALLPLPVRTAFASPDLVGEITVVGIEFANVDPGDVAEGCAGGETGRRLLRFSLRTRNIGPDDLLLGDPGCPDCAANPGAACANPLFVCSLAHGHAHFDSFAQMELLDSNGNLAALGHKYGFCLLDLECAQPQFTCAFQGISAGCADVYSYGLPCQYIDLTGLDLPDGNYTLRVILDPDNALAEADETNNVVTAPVQIAGGPNPVCPVYASTDIPKTIPDLGSATSTVEVPAAGAVTRVNVIDLRGTHTFDSDLEFHVTAPGGADVIVMDRRCDGGKDFDLSLSDVAVSAIPCPPTDGAVHLPSNALAGLAGGLATGTWTLKVYDRAAQDSGTLDGWGLEVCTSGCGDGVVDPGEQCDDGNTAAGDCCSPSCSVATPMAGCGVPTRPSASTLRLADGAPGKSDILKWRYGRGPAALLGDLGDPLATDGYRLCVFGESGTLPTLLYQVSAVPGGMCGTRPCWRPSGTQGYRFTDRSGAQDGLTAINLAAGGEGKTRLGVDAKSPTLGLPALPLALPVRVQLQNDHGTCWEANYSTQGTTRNDAGQFKGKSD